MTSPIPKNETLTIPEARALTCPRLACGPLVRLSSNCGRYADGWEVERVFVLDARGGRRTYSRAVRIDLEGTVHEQGPLRDADWRAQDDAKKGGAP